MKLAAILLSMLLAVSITDGQETQKNIGWQLFRSVTEVDNPLLDGSTLDGKPSRAKPIADSKINYLQLICGAAGDVGGEIQIKVRGGKGKGGPAIKSSEITLTLGTMQVLKDPASQGSTDLNYYAHAAAITSVWASGVGKSDDNGNGCVMIDFDCRGLDWVDIECVGLTNVTKANFYFSWI